MAETQWTLGTFGSWCCLRSGAEERAEESGEDTFGIARRSEIACMCGSGDVPANEGNAGGRIRSGLEDACKAIKGEVRALRDAQQGVPDAAESTGRR